MATVGIKRDLESVKDDVDIEDATNYFCPNLWMDLSVVLKLNRKMKRQRHQKTPREESSSNHGTSSSSSSSSSSVSSVTSDTIQDASAQSPPSVGCPSLYQIQRTKDGVNKSDQKVKPHHQQRRRRALPSASRAAPSTWRRGSGFSTVSHTTSEKNPIQTPLVKKNRSTLPQDHASPNVDLQLVEVSPQFCSPASQEKADDEKETPPITKDQNAGEEANSSPSTKNDSLIQQVSMYDGTVVATYTSVGKAAKAVDASPSAIYLCLSGKRKYAKGFYWKRAYVATTNPYVVQQISIHDDRIVATYSSVPEAALAVGCTKATIYNCLSGKRNTAIGYCWKKLYPISEESSSSTDVMHDDSDSSSTTTATSAVCSGSSARTPTREEVPPVVTPR